jgi:hypothetical protein
VGSDTARGRRGEGRRGRVSGIKQRETSTEPSKEWFNSQRRIKQKKTRQNWINLLTE